jgi:hypothetical protein
VALELDTTSALALADAIRQVLDASGNLTER